MNYAQKLHGFIIGITFCAFTSLVYEHWPRSGAEALYAVFILGLTVSICWAIIEFAYFQ